MAISKPLSVVIVVTIPIMIIVVASFIALQNIDSKNNQIQNLGKSKSIRISRKSSNPTSDQQFNHMMIDVYSMMSMARDIFPIDTTLAGREKSLSDIKDIGIYYWDRNLEVIGNLKKMNQKPEFTDKLSAYENYCRLSKTCYELMYKAIDEHTSKYNDEIDTRFAELTEMYSEITDEN